MTCTYRCPLLSKGSYDMAESEAVITINSYGNVFEHSQVPRVTCQIILDTVVLGRASHPHELSKALLIPEDPSC